MAKLNSQVILFLGILGISSVLGQNTTIAPSSTTTVSPTTVIVTTVSTKTAVTSTTPFPDEGYNCTEKGAFPHPIYCEYYYDCTDGVDTLIKCKPNLLFSLRYFGCDWPEDTDCGNRTRPEGYPGTVTPPAGSTTTSAPGNFDCNGLESGNYPDPEDCSSYYTCFHDVASHYHCGYPLMYNPETKMCDWPGVVDCGTRPIPTTKPIVL